MDSSVEFTAVLLMGLISAYCAMSRILLVCILVRNSEGTMPKCIELI